MKEIKFRQKLKNDLLINGQEYHYWGYIDGDFIGPVGPVYSDEKGQQLTGLKDKNGVDIYDGDSLQFDWLYQDTNQPYCSDSIRMIGYVCWVSGRFVCNHGGFSFDLHEINQSTFERFWKESYAAHDKDDYFKLTNIEVIANIKGN